MIKITDNKNAVSKAVLETFKYIADLQDYDVTIGVNDFDNCREQGYVLSLDIIDSNIVFDSIYFAFAENRNSDDIVVYKGTGIYHSHAIQSDEFWNSRKYFKYNEVYKAADYIFNEFRKFIKDYKVQKNEEK